MVYYYERNVRMQRLLISYRTIALVLQEHCRSSKLFFVGS